MSAGRPDVIVVGAGVVGAACAWVLAREGLQVDVIEGRFPGAGATGAAMGHLVVMDDSEAQFALTAYSRGLWEALARELPAECEDDPCGTLWLAADAEEMAHVHRKAEFYRARGVAVEVLSSSDLTRAEPNLRSGLEGALRVPGDRVLYPPNAVRWLLAGARAAGARLREGVAVDRIEDRAVMVGPQRLEADAVINAAGPEAGRLTPGLPIEPRKGHLVITDRYPAFCHHQLVELGYLKSAHALGRESVAFNVQPRATGQLLVGSSRELVGWDVSLNPRIRQLMIERAVSFLPRLAALRALRTWIGFRPTTPDKRPLIGRWPGTEGLWIAAGHEGLGVTMALGTGRLIGDLLLGRSAALDPSPFDPARFAAGASAA